MADLPKILGDVEKSVLFHRKDGDVCCIGTRQTDRYITAPLREADAVYEAMTLIDGSRTLDEVQSLSDLRLPASSRVDVEKLYGICIKAGLAESSSEEKCDRPHDELDVMLVDLKSFTLRGFYSAFSVVASILPFVVLAMVLVDIAACVMLGLSGESVPWGALLGDPRVILYAWIVQIPSIIIHEFAHATVAYRYGIRPKTLSFCIFYYCSLAFYVRIPGIYFRPEKERIAIWSAGVFANVFMAALFLMLYIASEGQLRLFFSVGVIVNISIALGNIMPFFYSDGYYILSTLLKTPNLRKKSLFGFKSLLKDGLTKGSMVYWLYLLVTVGVVLLVVGVQVIAVGGSIVGDITSGMALAEMVKKYFNVVLLVAIALIAKIVSGVQKRRSERV